MKKIAVLGLGRVGSLAGHLLDDAGFLVTGVDVKEPRLPLPFPVRCLDLHKEVLSLMRDGSESELTM